MAKFLISYEKMKKDEGGYACDPKDRGGETYRGVSRKYHPDWKGWPIIDANKWPGFTEEMKNPKNWSKADTKFHKLESLQILVHRFYVENFWNLIRGDEIEIQEIADAVYNFAVMTSPKRAIITAQMALGVTVDGDLGPKTLKALNSSDSKSFLSLFTVFRISYHVLICRKNSVQKRFFFTWVSRALGAI